MDRYILPANELFGYSHHPELYQAEARNVGLNSFLPRVSQEDLRA